MFPYTFNDKPATFDEVALTVMLNNKLAITVYLDIVGAKNVNELDYTTIFDDTIHVL